jgi:type III pantothenate kinase
VGGVREIVAHGVTGFVVAPGSTALVADAMLELLMDPRKRREMGAAAHERVQSGYSWESAATANLELFEEMRAKRHD